MDLLKGNFPVQQVQAEQPKHDPQSQYEAKARESIGGSMVFVERKKLIHDPQ